MAKIKKKVSIAEELAGQDNDEQVGVRMDNELYQAIGDYADRTDAESMSAAIRELLGMALTDTGILEDGHSKTVRENARRSAIRRMTAVMQAAVVTFRNEEVDFEEEDGEE